MTFPFSTLHLYTKMSKGLACQVPRSSSWSYTPRCMVLVTKAPELGVCAHSVHKDHYAQFFLHKDKLAAFQYVYTLHTHTLWHARTHTHTGHCWPVGCTRSTWIQDRNKASPNNVRTLSVVLACGCMCSIQLLPVHFMITHACMHVHV